LSRARRLLEQARFKGREAVVQNLITDVAGVRVGNSEDPDIATGVGVVLFEEPAVASVAILGGCVAWACALFVLSRRNLTTAM
jgi:hypothetical protein